MKGKISKETILISVIVGVICVTCVCCALYLTRDKSEPSFGNYQEQPLPDYTQFLPENAIKALFDEKGGAAYYEGALIYFENGEYKNADASPCVSEDGVLYVTTEQYGRKNAEELAAAMGAEYVVYDEKLLVLSYKKDFADTFSDIYTLEALALRLKGAGEADIANAFITLPNFISNGTTNSVYYTEPNLNLGVQTEIYGLQLNDYDTGYEKVKQAPMIVAGQGENGANNTLVRVFNSSQACVAQFLAFPPEVQGGVIVKTGRSSSGQALIAAAAYDASLHAAKTIKVFDTFGSLRYSFAPKGVEAPYSIAVGKFLQGSDQNYIFVASKFSDGSKSKYELYNIDDGSFVKSIQGGFDSSIGSQRITLSAYSPDGEHSEYQKLIVTFLDSKKVYYLDCNDSTWTKAELRLADHATGVYDSAFPGELVASLDEDTFSNVQIYGSGVSENLDGSLLNVGYKENRFYSTFAENNPDGFVDYAEFNHIRTDLGNGVIDKLNGYGKQKLDALLNYLENTEYDDWEYKLSKAEKKKFHSQYNVWEPCFTHRWNAIQAMQNLVAVVDSATGYPAYASIGRDNASGVYQELDSAFLVGTYADGILDLAKLRLYPLRTMLQQLAVEFRGSGGNPERLVDVSPVHEQEINVPGSVGDYHPNMIAGFRKYLLSLFGSVENINRRFGTEFASEAEIDAPRFDPEGTNANPSRGEWDVYGKSEYFTQWSLYTRNIINKRILEAYREALLAGFPPEAINAHQIPEGDAVSGFLGEADTRISPTDVVSICGTAYGGTRYGYFCNDLNNFIQLAYGGGHTNMTLGEYSSLSTDWNEAYAQLKYLFDHGVKFTHIIVPYDTNDKMYAMVKTAEEEAIIKLQQENAPRSAATGGTGASEPVRRGDASYNIVQIGGSDKNGLLKSIKQDGSWEGSVYLAPFHSQVAVKPVEMQKTENGYDSALIKGLQYGDQAELTFLASYSGGSASVKIEVYHAGCLLEDATAVYEITSQQTPLRYVLSNQLSMEDIQIKMTFLCDDRNNMHIENLQCTSQVENVAHKYFGDMTAAANKGGVSFAIVE
ncbi:MAG: hypothetical protein ACLSVG_09250 [Clostridia bacterium]